MDMHDYEERTIEALVAYAGDQGGSSRVDARTGSVFVDLQIWARARTVIFDKLAAHGIGSIDDTSERAKITAALFARSESWPDGEVEIRCIGDSFEATSMTTHTDLVAFIDEKPVGRGVRINVPTRRANPS
jgi:hypothetical protein